MARPSSYTTDIAEKICDLIAEDPRGLGDICAEHEDLPDSRTVWRWLAKYEEFRLMYARAKEKQAEVLAEEILEIADDKQFDTIVKKRKDGSEYEAENHDWINRCRLRVDARKWLLAKLAPRRYGDRIAQEISNPDGSLTGKLTDAQVAAKLEAIQQAALKRKKEAADDYSDLA